MQGKNRKKFWVDTKSNKIYVESNIINACVSHDRQAERFKNLCQRLNSMRYPEIFFQANTNNNLKILL